jgi:NitT/TauT family transport system ATP-binding protein
MVTHDIREAFGLATRVLTLDKRRHDPHAPHRYGATAVYDLALDRRVPAVTEQASEPAAEESNSVGIVGP